MNAAPITPIAIKILGFIFLLKFNCFFTDDVSETIKMKTTDVDCKNQWIFWLTTIKFEHKIDITDIF